MGVTEILPVDVESGRLGERWTVPCTQVVTLAPDGSWCLGIGRPDGRTARFDRSSRKPHFLADSGARPVSAAVSPDGRSLVLATVMPAGIG